MRVLFDENVPENLRHSFQDYYVATVTWMGWKGVENGSLLRLAESQFDVLITLDKNMPFQQNLSKWQLGFIIIAVLDDQLESLLPLVPRIRDALHTVRPGAHVYIGDEC